ncbi:MAG: hypothetical protein HC905_14950 [Bacteroidales bacterium]|nr:hypothetical protein [Bacteroidales bacterium]
MFLRKRKNPVGYKIEERYILPEELSETSGIISYNNHIWTFNDSGGKPVIYSYSREKDSIIQMITLDNTINKDWEDIAQDKNYIYIGDFGNNMGTRDSLIIYRINKSSIPLQGNTTIIPDRIIYKYPDYTPEKFPVSFSAFDCEAMITYNDSLYVFTKNWTDGTTTIYGVPNVPGVFTAKMIKQLNAQGLITGADYVDNKLILIGYSNFIPFLWYFSTNDLYTLNEKNGIRIELNDIATYQTEGICIDGDKVFITSEKTRSPAQLLQIDLEE